VRSPLLNHLRERGNVESATVFSSSGKIVATADTEIDSLMPERPASPSCARPARPGLSGRGGQAPDGLICTGHRADPFAPPGRPQLLQLTQHPCPARSRPRRSVETVHRDYQELSLARDGLRRIYTLTLTLTLLLALFAAVCRRLRLTRRLAAPLFILAEGTQAVAAGISAPAKACPPATSWAC
jgi:nitrogen fixation/metabolism regulation signal transduction histidine kinase